MIISFFPGRLINVRSSSKRRKFYDLLGDGEKVQVMAAVEYVK